MQRKENCTGKEGDHGLAVGDPTNCGPLPWSNCGGHWPCPLHFFSFIPSSWIFVNPGISHDMSMLVVFVSLLLACLIHKNINSSSTNILWPYKVEIYKRA